MNRFARIGAVAILALSLTGCASTIGGMFGYAAGPQTTQDALRAVQFQLTTYRDVYQNGLIAYLGLPPCPQAQWVACKDMTVVPKLKAVDLAATAAIVAAKSVLEGNVTDAGQIETAIRNIGAAEQAISAAGVALKN